MAVRGQRNIEFFAACRAQLGQLADELDGLAAQQRLTTGNAYLLDAKSGKHARAMRIVGKGRSP